MRWGDMDRLGHVNNTLYFRYMEVARFAWLKNSRAIPGTAAQGVVLINAFCNFLRQLEFPGEVLVKTYVGKVGRSAADTWVTMAHADAPDVVCANGGATLVWVDYAAHKSLPFPDDFRAFLQGPQV